MQQFYLVFILSKINLIDHHMNELRASFSRHFKGTRAIIGVYILIKYLNALICGSKTQASRKT